MLKEPSPESNPIICIKIGGDYSGDITVGSASQDDEGFWEISFLGTEPSDEAKDTIAEAIWDGFRRIAAFESPRGSGKYSMSDRHIDHHMV